MITWLYDLVNYHHLNGNDARTDARQHEPKPEKSEIADDDREGKEDAVYLECVERQSIAQWERYDEHDTDGNIDTVPPTIGYVYVYRVQESTQLLSKVPVS